VWLQLYDRAKAKLSPLKYFTGTHTILYVFFSFVEYVFAACFFA